MLSLTVAADQDDLVTVDSATMTALSRKTLIVDDDPYQRSLCCVRVMDRGHVNRTEKQRMCHTVGLSGNGEEESWTLKVLPLLDSWQMKRSAVLQRKHSKKNRSSKLSRQVVQGSRHTTTARQKGLTVKDDGHPHC